MDDCDDEEHGEGAAVAEPSNDDEEGDVVDFKAAVADDVTVVAVKDTAGVVVTVESVVVDRVFAGVASPSTVVWVSNRH